MDINRDWIEKYDKPLLIAGPCSAESEQQLMETAERLPSDYVHIYRAGIWKPRTKPNCFEGVGAIGLKWLKAVKEKYGYLTTTEVANADHVELCLENDVDIFWIGARTTVNPFQVQEIAEALKGTDKVVLVKNPVNPDLALWMGAFERLHQQGLTRLGAIHRGFSSYRKNKYRNAPQWQIALDFKNQNPNIPLLCDPSHIAGSRDLIFEVAQQAFNFEFNGLMVETHRDPDAAWSDAAQQVTPENLLEILKAIELRYADDPNAEFHISLDGLRGQIDDLDRSLLEILTERMRVVKEIGNLKKGHNVAVFQPQRWSVIKDTLRENGEKMGLNADFVENILKNIHQESVQVQNKIMSNGTSK